MQKPKPHRTVEESIEHVIEHALTASRNDPTRTTSLRVSSFPFCPVRWFYGLPVALSKNRQNSYMSGFFTGIGHAVHHGIQAITETSDNVIRDWLCLKCLINYEFQLRPEKCSKCGESRFHSQESQVKQGVILGHIDDAFLLPDGIWINDYKTTSKAMLKTKKLPHLYNVRQIEAYCAIKSAQGEPIAGWVLTYIARDNGARRYVTSKEYYGHSYSQEYEAIVRRVKKYITDYKYVSKLTKESELEHLLSLRRYTQKDRTPEAEILCTDCEYKPACATDKMALHQAHKVFKLVQAKLPVLTTK